MWQTWIGRGAWLCVVLTVVVGWHFHTHAQRLALQHREEHRLRRELARVHDDLARVTALPVRPLVSWEHALQHVRQVVAGLREAGISATLTTGTLGRISLSGQSPAAVPCELTLRSEALFPLIDAVRAIEQGQVREDSWVIDAQGSRLQFHVFGADPALEARRAS